MMEKKLERCLTTDEMIDILGLVSTEEKHEFLKNASVKYMDNVVTVLMLSEIVNALPSPISKMFVILTIATGFTPAEVLAIQWKNIRYTSIQLSHIIRSVRYRNNVPCEIRAGEMFFPPQGAIPDEYLFFVKWHKKSMQLPQTVEYLLQDWKKLQIAKTSQDYGFVFSQMNGYPCSDTMIKSKVNSDIKLAGYRDLKLSDLRNIGKEFRKKYTCM